MYLLASFPARYSSFYDRYEDQCTSNKISIFTVSIPSMRTIAQIAKTSWQVIVKPMAFMPHGIMISTLGS